jgi:hypothetical protein
VVQKISKWEPWAVLGLFVAIGAILPSAGHDQSVEARAVNAIVVLVFLLVWLFWPLSVLSRVGTTSVKVKRLLRIATFLAAFSFALAAWHLLGLLVTGLPSAGFAVLFGFLASFVLIAAAFSALPASSNRVVVFFISFVSLYFLPIGAFYLKNLAAVRSPDL